jgi:pimeloyl-ACP methyl ester carboxylesterase
MEAPESPVVVLVHGAWHGAWCWTALQAELDRRGIPSLAIDLPGHGASTEPYGDLLGDAVALSALLAKQQRPIVLVGHSYGGAVISQAVAETGNVIHLVYLAAFVPDVGENVVSMSTTMPEASTALAGAIKTDGGFSTIDPAAAWAAFYAHCDPMSATANIARLDRQPFATFTQEATHASWRSTPSTYVVCTDDAAVHPSHQQLMAARCTHTESLATDHSPFASMPLETAEIIARIARG